MARGSWRFDPGRRVEARVAVVDEAGGADHLELAVA
jgi:hypothetical protein